MRYPASEKLEIIRLVERSSRPAKWTLDKLGVNRRTFYRWYDRYLHYGEDGLVDRAPILAEYGTRYRMRSGLRF